jgi:hypothetical protein
VRLPPTAQWPASWSSVTAGHSWTPYARGPSRPRSKVGGAWGGGGGLHEASDVMCYWQRAHASDGASAATMCGAGSHCCHPAAQDSRHWHSSWLQEVMVRQPPTTPPSTPPCWRWPWHCATCTPCTWCTVVSGAERWKDMGRSRMPHTLRTLPCITQVPMKHPKADGLSRVSKSCLTPHGELADILRCACADLKPSNVLLKSSSRDP